MNRYFGSWLTIWSPAVGRKSANMISTIGRSPTRLIPSATPTKPFSAIGVTRTRSRPYFSTRPPFVLKTPPSASTSSPMRRTAGSEARESSRAALIASRYVISTVAAWSAAGRASVSVDIRARLLEGRVRGCGGSVGCRVHLVLQFLLDPCLVLCGEDPVSRQPTTEHLDGVARLPGIELAVGPVLRGVRAGVSAIAVRLHLEQGRAIAAARPLDGVADGAVHDIDVLAVDDDPGHPVRVRSPGEVGAAAGRR